MDATVTRVKQTTVMNNMNKPEPALEVEYMVGTHGPFTETFKKADFSASNVKQKLSELAQHISQL